ncbi:GH21447 [Drosophila grimshawi]|uniref:GH21447 n=1 Tax=Drosophila grimshawi TaxID=7222 RepID=B4J9P3_DROGR|nr:GH21447 [Drosophila grimshawi]
MLKLKLKEVSRKNRQVAAWWQPENAVALQWHRKSNWDLTQQLHKSNAEQLRQELHILLVTCVLAGSAPFGTIENPDGATGIWFSYTSLWLLLQIGKMFYILYFNHNVQQEHTSCLALLMKVRTDSDELLETIHHFILQLQTNVRAHVACGLFEMDYKLIPALLMTTASLFIFLLQYDITFKALHSAANGTAI